MRLQLLEELAVDITSPTTGEELERALMSARDRMGFDHFALSYDQWRNRSPINKLLLHDYPERWAQVYVSLDLMRNDPVRRACERSFTGFAWHDLARYITLTRGDRKMLDVGIDNGLLDGYTVPRHLPGLATGSCSFVVGRGRKLPVSMLPIAEVIGALALMTARKISGMMAWPVAVVLSDRQRECVLWSARGLTAQQTADILGISRGTVIQHLREARERYEVNCSESLILCTLFDGLISFADIFEWWHLN